MEERRWQIGPEEVDEEGERGEEVEDEAVVFVCWHFRGRARHGLKFVGRGIGSRRARWTEERGQGGGGRERCWWAAVEGWCEEVVLERRWRGRRA